MKRAILAGSVIATAVALIALAASSRPPAEGAANGGALASATRVAAAGPAASSALSSSASADGPSSADALPPMGSGGGLLYGRVTTEEGLVYQGRLRFGAAYGRNEEALWSHTFNAVRDGNPWAEHAPREAVLGEPFSVELFGFEVSLARSRDLGRPFMVRFGDIRRIEARGRDLEVTLKSGTVVHLARYGADDFADGVRVWDGARGIVDLNERRVRSIEFLAGEELGTDPSAPPDGAAPLFGTVRTRQGDFTGFIQWNRRGGLASDELVGRTAEGEVSFRFDALRSIERRSGEAALVTLHDGREVVLSSTRGDGNGNSGMYVDDPRYGRVLVSWDAFEQVDFATAPAAPGYGDFPAGLPLTGSVTTLSGRELSGRLVYDLDESETVETLDAPWQGVDYTIPFGLIAEVVLADPGEGGGRDASITLRDGGEVITLERAGDLGDGNAGLLVFADGRQRADHVPWSEVARIRFDPPVATYPPSGGR